MVYLNHFAIPETNIKLISKINYRSILFKKKKKRRLWAHQLDGRHISHPFLLRFRPSQCAAVRGHRLAVLPAVLPAGPPLLSPQSRPALLTSKYVFSS